MHDIFAYEYQAAPRKRRMGRGAASVAITLRGMTWSHPRGYDPLVACADAWRKKTGVSVGWEKRSLQDFETYPVEDLARATT